MGIKELPIFVWVFLQLVMLPVSLLALPVLGALTACQLSITANVFATGSGETALHALLWPLRLIAVAGVLATLAAVPASGVWLAQVLLGSGGAWSVIMAAAAVLIVVVGTAWILSAHGIWSYLPAWHSLRLGDLAAGMADSVADLVAAVCLVIVVATVIRLPWLLLAVRSGHHNPIANPRPSVRGQLVAQAAFAVADLLIMPLVAVLFCTMLRLPRLLHQLRRVDKHMQDGNLSCTSVMNSWPARAVVVAQALHLFFVDIILLLPLCVVVACSLYRLRYLVLDFKESFALQSRRQVDLSVWSFLGKDIEAPDDRSPIASVLAQLELAVVSQFVLLLLDVIFLAPMLLVTVTLWRVPTTFHGVRAAINRSVRSPDEAFRHLDDLAMEMRMIVLWEALTVVVLDVPTFLAALLNILLLYRSVTLCQDICYAKREKGAKRAEDLQPQNQQSLVRATDAGRLPEADPLVRAPRSTVSRYEENKDTQMRMRSVVWCHLWLVILDVLTVGAFLILVATVYRLPKTIRKLGGYENVWNRTGRHWSMCTLHANVPRLRAGEAAHSPSRPPRRANFYILKRAAKVPMDIVIAVPLIACALVPWKLPLIAADIRLLLWCRAPGLRVAKRPKAQKPHGCLFGDQFGDRSARDDLTFSIRASWLLGVVTTIIVAFIFHWSAIKFGAADIVPGEWCQSERSAYRYADVGNSSTEGSEELVIRDVCMLGGLAIPILVLCCCSCFCCKSCGCCSLGAPNDGFVDQIEDGMRRTVRYKALQNLALVHLLLLPIDLFMEPICLVCLAVLKITRWRYAPLKTDAGTSLSVSGWIAKRPRRYGSTAKHTLHWLLDFPAVVLLVVLIVTLLRSRDVIMDLVHFFKPNRSAQAQNYYQRSQESYERLRRGVAAITNDDDASSLVRNRKFPKNLSPGLARAERRLALAKLLNDRLTSDMDEEVPFLPVEVIECIAYFAVPVFRVPHDWFLAQDALAAAPPDATILLAPGVHRIELERQRYQYGMHPQSNRNITIEGTGQSAGDVIIIPLLRSDETSMGSASMFDQARNAVHHCPDGFLKNVTVVIEPAAVRKRTFSDETEVTEWRQLVWRNGALLLLELPFPMLALLCLWRIPELVRTLRAPDRVFDEYTRIGLTVQTIVKVILDIPACAALLLMAITGWRVPSLLRARQNHSSSHSPYRTIASEFCVWLCDLPFAALCIAILPFIWRTPYLLRTLWNVGEGIGSNRTEVWRTVVTPVQRILVARCGLLCILDLFGIAVSPLLVIFPWRGAQCLAVIRYERMCSRVESFGQWQHFDTNASTTFDGRPILSPLRKCFDFETQIIRSWFKVRAVEFAGDSSTKQPVVLHQGDIDKHSTATYRYTLPEREPGPEPEPQEEAMEPPTLAQDGWIEPREAVTFAMLYCEYKSIADLWRLVETAFILVMGFRHLPYLYRELKGTITRFRTAGQFTDRYVNFDFIDDDVQLCRLLCCLPCLCCWCCVCFSNVDAYVGVLEECSYTGKLNRQNHGQVGGPGASVHFRYGQTLLLSVSPSLSSTMLHPSIDKTFAKAMWDIPHLLLIPIKLLAVFLSPIYFYLMWRYTPRAQESVLRIQRNSDGGQVLEQEDDSLLPPIVSVFLLPCRPIAEHESNGLSFWNAHKSGLAFLLATPFCVLDLCALIYAQVICILFAWPLTLLGPLWNAHREAAGFVKLGCLLPKGLTSWKLHAANDLMVFVQALSLPVLLGWILISSFGPLLLWMDAPMLLLPTDWRNSSSGSGSSASELVGQMSTLSGGIWFGIGAVVWLVIAIGGCFFTVPFCMRHFPLFNPRRAWVIILKKVASGRLLKLYSELLIRPTVWSYARRGADSKYIGEFVIPLVAFVWVFWPVLAVMPTALAGHCYPGSDSACGESTWATTLFVATYLVPGCISLYLAIKCLGVLRRHWRQPLTAEEHAELIRPHLDLQAVLLRVPDDGVGIIVQIDATKEREFSASKVQLQVVSGDLVWKAFERALSASARMLLPYVRRSLLPFDLTEFDCMQSPSTQLRKGETTVSLEISVGCTGQPMATKAAAMRPFLAKLASGWGDAPDLELMLEYPTPLGWANLVAISISLDATLQMFGSPGEIHAIVDLRV